MTLFSAGWNLYKQLGRDGDESKPGPVDFEPCDFRCFSAGQLHSIIVDKQGSVYGFGSNKNGGLGFLSEEIFEKPTKIDINEKIIWADCGFCITVLLSESGTVYILGDGEPIRADLPEPCIFVCCGYYMMWAVGRSGDVYQFGDTGEDPVKFDMPAKVVQIAAGNGFAVAISEDKEAYGCGTVCPDSPSSFVKIPSLNNIEIQKISSFESHCVALSTDGRVFVWGSGVQGKLGLGNYENASEFMIVKFNERIIDVSAGLLHTCFVTEDGTLYSSGSNEYGQLLLENVEMIEFPTKSSLIKDVTAVECGNHTLLLVNGKPIKYPMMETDELKTNDKKDDDEKGDEKKPKSGCCLLI